MKQSGALFLWITLVLALPGGRVHAQSETRRISEIYFFGYSGLALGRVRTALPVRVGDAVSHDTDATLRQSIRSTVTRVTGAPPTDIAFIGPAPEDGLFLYIGLRGKNSRSLRFSPPPRGDARLPQRALALDTAMSGAWLSAASRGVVAEDDSRGYALSVDPAARDRQRAVRQFALSQGPLLCRVVETAEDVAQRRAAAEMLGYADQSQAQIAALVHASRDADEKVRNNALRALGVVAQAGAHKARLIPTAGFIEMLNSGTWTDRNKAGMLLFALTASRDAPLLTQLRHQALSSLTEMARWDAGHAQQAQMILGRIAGIPERRLGALVQAGHVDAILDALPGTPPHH